MTALHVSLLSSRHNLHHTHYCIDKLTHRTHSNWTLHAHGTVSKSQIIYKHCSLFSVFYMVSKDRSSIAAHGMIWFELPIFRGRASNSLCAFDSPISLHVILITWLRYVHSGPAGTTQGSIELIESSKSNLTKFGSRIKFSSTAPTNQIRAPFLIEIQLSSNAYEWLMCSTWYSNQPSRMHPS